MSASQEPQTVPTPGLVESFKALLLTFVSSLYTRFEIATIEIEEERERLEQLLLLGVACMFCLCTGVLLASLLFVALAWDTPYRIAVFATITVLHFAVGGALVILLRNKISNKPRLLSTTLSELAKDRDSLRQSLP